jgi:hypothetical protein
MFLGIARVTTRLGLALRFDQRNASCAWQQTQQA